MRTDPDESDQSTWLNSRPETKTVYLTWAFGGLRKTQEARLLTFKELKMLVLSRKKNQTVVIDNQIEIEVLKIKGNTVRLGIKAPSHIKVLRGELAPFEVEIDIKELGDFKDSTINESSNEQPIGNPFVVAQAS